MLVASNSVYQISSNYKIVGNDVKMISDNKNYLTKMQKVDNNFNTIGYKNKLNNPCTWSHDYKKNMNYGNQPKDKKYPNFKLSLPTGPAGVKSCKIRNCQKLGKA